MNFTKEGPTIISPQYLGAGDGAIWGKLLPESLIVYAIIQVLHIEIHPLQSECEGNSNLVLAESVQLINISR